MIRLVVAALLLTVPMAASAATAVHKPMAKPAVTKVAAKKPMKPMKAAPRYAGSAETDRLNEQSLMKAMGK